MRLPAWVITRLSCTASHPSHGIKWNRSSNSGAHMTVWISWYCQRNLRFWTFSWAASVPRRFPADLRTPDTPATPAPLPAGDGHRWQRLKCRSRSFQLSSTHIRHRYKSRSTLRSPCPSSLHTDPVRSFKRSLLFAVWCARMTSRPLPITDALWTVRACFAARSMPLTATGGFHRCSSPFPCPVPCRTTTGFFWAISAVRTLFDAGASARCATRYAASRTRYCPWWSNDRTENPAYRTSRETSIRPHSLRVVQGDHNKSIGNDRLDAWSPSPRPLAVNTLESGASGSKRRDPNPAAVQFHCVGWHIRTRIRVSNRIEYVAWQGQ